MIITYCYVIITYHHDHCLSLALLLIVMIIAYMSITKATVTVSNEWFVLYSLFTIIYMLLIPISRSTIQEIIRSYFGYHKICVKCAPKMLIPDHLTRWFGASLELLSYHNEERKVFKDHIVTYLWWNISGYRRTPIIRTPNIEHPNRWSSELLSEKKLRQSYTLICKIMIIMYIFHINIVLLMYIFHLNCAFLWFLLI